MACIDDLAIEDDIFDPLMLCFFLVSIVVGWLGMQFSYLASVALIEG